jgi:uncharacterized protein
MPLAVMSATIVAPLTGTPASDSVSSWPEATRSGHSQGENAEVPRRHRAEAFFSTGNDAAVSPRSSETARPTAAAADEGGSPHGLLDPDEMLRRLEARLGPLHAQLRLGMEREHEAQAFGQGLSFLHLENLPWMQVFIEIMLRVTGTYRLGLANAGKVKLRRNIVRLAKLPSVFDGFTILHLSDLHADLSVPAMRRAAEIADGLDYDLCVLTGDYRGLTYGDCKPCLEGVARLRRALRGEIYAVLGNHDSITMVPDLEALGIRVLLNECVALNRGGASIYLAGIDDAHFFRADDIGKATADIPDDCVSILLSHTPEIYGQAAHAGFDLMLCGHTHGGQICLPGGVPILLEADLPRAFGAGAWWHRGMAGYTSLGTGSSVVPVRFNNRPEMTMHRLARGETSVRLFPKAEGKKKP